MATSWHFALAFSYTVAWFWHFLHLITEKKLGFTLKYPVSSVPTLGSPTLMGAIFVLNAVLIVLISFDFCFSMSFVYAFYYTFASMLIDFFVLVGSLAWTPLISSKWV